MMKVKPGRHQDMDKVRAAQIGLDVKGLSSQEFLQLGMDYIAYIKPVEAEGERIGYAVQSADGQTLSIEESFAAALDNLQASSLHGVLLQ